MLMDVGITRNKTLKRRDLNDWHALDCAGKTYSKPSSGHAGGRRPGQTRKKPPESMWSWGAWAWGGWGCVCCRPFRLLKIRLRKKPMNLCACDSEDREHGVGAGVNDTMLSDTLAIISPRVYVLLDHVLSSRVSDEVFHDYFWDISQSWMSN
jgi:hypothetical protein